MMIMLFTFSFINEKEEKKTKSEQEKLTKLVLNSLNDVVRLAHLLFAFH